jgi:hypothetical protein
MMTHPTALNGNIASNCRSRWLPLRKKTCAAFLAALIRLLLENEKDWRLRKWEKRHFCGGGGGFFPSFPAEAFRILEIPPLRRRSGGVPLADAASVEAPLDRPIQGQAAVPELRQPGQEEEVGVFFVPVVVLAVMAVVLDVLLAVNGVAVGHRF